MTDDAGLQHGYHNELFGRLYRWDEVWDAAVEMAGTREHALTLGLDELGHFGGLGTELVADRLLASADGQLERVLELGSGYGGALRHMRRLLDARGAGAALLGVELVSEHCALAEAINRTLGESPGFVVHADARDLPLAPECVDAVFATGSASHFADMGRVLTECHRVLRPGGVLVMTEEVSLRPAGGAAVGDAFLARHPPGVFHAATPEQRRAELLSAGFAIESFEPRTEWGTELLRQQAQALQLLGACAADMFGAEACDRVVATLTSAADEYERGSVEPALIVARRSAQEVTR